VLQGDVFKKSTKKQYAYKDRINKSIEEILANPTKAGTLILAKTYKGIRHYKVTPNLTIFYAYCAEANEMREGLKCPWCPPGTCDTTDGEMVVLLEFGSHDIMDNIRR